MGAPTSKANGTTSALSIGVETDLGSSITDAGVYQLDLDLSNLASGENLELRVYKKVLTGDSEQVCDTINFFGVVTDPNFCSPIYVNLFSCRFTLKQTTGTGRTYKWNVSKLS